MCSDAETEPPGTPAQLGGEGRKDVRDRKSGGKKRRDRRQGCGRGSAVVAAAASQWGGRGGEEGGGRGGEGEGDRRGPPTLLQENRSSAGPRSGAPPSLICQGPAITVALFS